MLEKLEQIKQRLESIHNSSDVWVDYQVDVHTSVMDDLEAIDQLVDELKQDCESTVVDPNDLPY